MFLLMAEKILKDWLFTILNSKDQGLWRKVRIILIYLAGKKFKAMK